MELTNDFDVSVPAATAWAVLTDVERIAPCLPGAKLEEVAGDEYRGIVKVKVGPITAQYQGTASFVEQDEGAGKAVLKASGRDTRGQGNASATITATLVDKGPSTHVEVVTDLNITGKVAQFGRGVMADVSKKLLGEFVTNLEKTVLTELAAAPAGDEEPAAAPAAKKPAAKKPVAKKAVKKTTKQAVAKKAAPKAAPKVAPSEAAAAGNGAGASSSEGEPEVRRIESSEPEPIDLGAAAGGSVAKRVVPVVVGVILIVLFVRFRRRRRRASE